MSQQRPVVVVTDSTADLQENQIGSLPISIVPLVLDVEGQIYRDGVDLSSSQFVQALHRGAFPQTSQPPIGAFQAIYRQKLDEGYDIVSIHIAEQLSGTINSARAAARMSDPDRIHIIDSTTVSTGTGLLAIEAAEMAETGSSASEIATFITNRTSDQRLYATLESLEYLRRGGRIGRASALLGSALQLKPIIRIQNGVVEPIERVRTYKRAIDRLTTLFEQEGPFDRVAILHLDAQKVAGDLYERASKLQPGVNITIGTIGTVIGSYGGPGLVGFVGLVSHST